jgi:predicted transcriptional regulator
MRESPQKSLNSGKTQEVNKMYPDQEINALNDVYKALRGLNPAQIKRIIEWLASKYHLDKQQVRIVSRDEVVGPSTTVPADEAPSNDVITPTVKKRRGRPPKKVESVLTEPLVQPDAETASTPGTDGFTKFDSFEDLFFSSNAKTIAATILLAAAYLQEKERLTAINTSAISKLMKKVGQQVQNISASINNLLTKTPSVLMQTGKQGDSKQARRQYQVTEEGIRIARNYIND